MIKAILSAGFTIAYWTAMYIGIEWVKKHHASMPVFNGGTAMELSTLAVAMMGMAFAVAGNQWKGK